MVINIYIEIFVLFIVVFITTAKSVSSGTAGHKVLSVGYKAFPAVWLDTVLPVVRLDLKALQVIQFDVEHFMRYA